MELSVTGDSPVADVFTRQPATESVCVADGYDVRAHVRGGHLVIEDGTRRIRRVRRYPRSDTRTTGGLARVVILGTAGYVTMEAVRWCADLGIPIVQADRDGCVLLCSPGMQGDARIRESQVHAQVGGRNEQAGLRIARELTAVKLDGQETIARTILHRDTHAARIKAQAARVAAANRMPDILGAEANAANAYWAAWKDHVFAPFRPQDMLETPAAWHTFTSRMSPDERSGRNANDPINAILNYAYRVCETEALLACRITGLDPVLGFVHGHSHCENAMVFDLIETVRPEADRIILSMLDTGHGVPIGDNGRPSYLDMSSFTETRVGVCRIEPPLTHVLSERVTAAIALVVGRHAEWVAKELAIASQYKVPIQKRVTADPRFVPPTPRPSRVSRYASQMRPDHEITPSEVVSDDLWTRVQPLIPPEPVSVKHKPVSRSDNRAVLAGIIYHEIHGVPWMHIPTGLGIDRKTCRNRLSEWQTLGVWPDMLAIIESRSVPR
jgi:CRISPR-associated protein Cas1